MNNSDTRSKLKTSSGITTSDQDQPYSRPSSTRRQHSKSRNAHDRQNLYNYNHERDNPRPRERIPVNSAPAIGHFYSNHSRYPTQPIHPLEALPILHQPAYSSPLVMNRPHPDIQSTPWHNFGSGPQPSFGWSNVTPRPHSYGAPKYYRRQQPDYRRFCYSVGKADVPFASLPGGPLEGMPSHMAPQMIRQMIRGF